MSERTLLEKSKAIRIKLGITQAEFASLLHVSNDVVKNWESKARRPPSGIYALMIELFFADPVGMKRKVQSLRLM